VYYKLSIKLYKQTTTKFNRLQRIAMGILCILFWIASFPVLFWSYIRVVHPVLHFWSHGIPFKINFIIAWHLLVMILYLSYIYIHFCSIKKSDSESEFWKFSDTQKSSWICKFQSMLQLPCICNIFCFRWEIPDVLPILMRL